MISFTFLGILLIGVGRSIDYIGAFHVGLLSIILLFSERKIFQETALYFEHPAFVYRDIIATTWWNGTI